MLYEGFKAIAKLLLHSGFILHAERFDSLDFIWNFDVNIHEPNALSRAKSKDRMLTRKQNMIS